AMQVQLGLLRDDAEAPKGRRAARHAQPVSYEAALPPGYGQPERAGRGGGSGRGARASQSFPSDSFGTGLMISGGLANGHPFAGKGQKAQSPGGAKRSGADGNPARSRTRSAAAGDRQPDRAKGRRPAKSPSAER